MVSTKRSIPSEEAISSGNVRAKGIIDDTAACLWLSSPDRAALGIDWEGTWLSLRWCD